MNFSSLQESTHVHVSSSASRSQYRTGLWYSTALTSSAYAWNTRSWRRPNIYHHESDNNQYNTSALWETALQAPGEHITVGDFNAHHPLWGGDIEPDSAGEQVLQTIDRFGLSSLLHNHLGKRTVH